jgi:serine/threonine-protein kinase
MRIAITTSDSQEGRHVAESLVNYPQIILSGTDPDLPEPPLHGYEKYSDFQEIARGMKAVLHSCWDSVLGRTIAIKRLLPEHATDGYERRRFLREARVTAQLQHPNTVPVYEIGKDDEGGLYFTMKRLTGENFFKILQRLSWGDAVAERRLGLDVQIEFIIQACQALAYSHLHGIIHRDIKPENIWIGEYGEVVLLDWGVAKVWGTPNDGHMPETQQQDDVDASLPHEIATSDEGELRTLTMHGQRPGTPLYMSPEQVRDRPLDERTDIFSMGVLIYEMLTFHEPFRGRTVEETFQRILHVPLKPPSEAAPDRHLPESLDRIVTRATSKNREDRYDSVLEMISELRAARLDVLRAGDRKSAVKVID